MENKKNSGAVKQSFYAKKAFSKYCNLPFQDLRSASAVALLQGEGESSAKGEIVFFQRHPPSGPILVRGNLTDLPSGKHGLHIHQSGDLRQGCEKLGAHFNPYLVQLNFFFFCINKDCSFNMVARLILSVMWAI